MAVEQSVPTAVTPETILVGGTAMNEQMYNQRVVEVRSDYASALSDIEDKFDTVADQITTIQSGIISEINENKQVAANSYNNIMSDMDDQITNIQHAQNMQVTQSASQLDSMLASGQFGGNVYRSQQVYAMNMSNIIASSMSVVSDVTLQYRMAAENLQAEYSSQQLSAYVNGAGIVLGAMTDLAKSYALVRADMTSSKNDQINEIYSLKAQMDMANAELATQTYIAEMQVSAQKLMTQWQLDASMEETLLNIELADRQLEASLYMAEQQDTLSRDLAEMSDTLQRDMQQYDADLQKYLQEKQIEYQVYATESQLSVEMELGLAQLQQAASSSSANMQLGYAQLAETASQFDEQFAMQKETFAADMAQASAFMDQFAAQNAANNALLAGQTTTTTDE